MIAQLRNRIRLLVPAPAKPVLRGGYAAVDPLLRWIYRRRSGERRPIPPARLRARVGNPGIGWFFESAWLNVGELERALEGAGRPLRDFASALDFGCGCGRVLQELDARTGATPALAGCDVDEQAVGWAKSRYPTIDFRTNRFRPPLPHEDAAFDLVYSSSVFTHIDEQAQDEWLLELRRVLSPDGVAVLSVQGEHALEEFRRGRVVGNSWAVQRRIARLATLGQAGFLFEPYERSVWTESEYVGKGDTYGLTFHSESYIRRRWSPLFDVLGVLPRAWLGFQDLAVLRRPS